DATGAPGCISTAVTVGATTKSDVVATYSNSASFVDVLAPGSSINSSIPGGGFDSWNGTSMAAPHVAGAFAVLRQAYPTLTVDQIEDALKSTGLPVSDSPRGAAAPLAITKPRIRVKEAFDALAAVTPTPTGIPTVPPITGGGGGSGGGCTAGAAPWALLLALPLMALLRR
ncbi:MAG TPA: S8 family serine peptidase, partial [Synergistaceae bacterium]|nr:S8 family serine peptidase [Synergistaceae bacterium]